MKGTMTDMNDVSSKYSVIPIGEYKVYISEKVDGISKNGDPMIKVVWKVNEGEHRGRFIFDNLVISSNKNSPAWKIRWRAKMFLQSIGEPHNGDNFDWDSDNWEGKECIVKVEHSEYNGDTQAKITKYIQLPESEIKKISESQDGSNLF
jgi:Protein of unknown function (DUF669)